MRMKSTIKNCATIAPRGPGTMPPELCRARLELPPDLALPTAAMPRWNKPLAR
jgi:hypothetical protein